jgi:site-specific DNA-methyltransferase (adenine-specific)
VLELDKIYNMDCLDGLKEIPNRSIDVVLTDPPYFLPINSYVGTRKNGYHKRTLADASILKGYFERIFEQLSRVIKKDGTYYIFCDAQSYPIFYQVMFPYCSHVRLLIWDKIASYNGYTWRHQHELIAWGEQDKTKRVPTGDGDVLKFRGVLQEDRNHPAEKPVELIQSLLLKNGHEGCVVLDPYIGSGSTAIACKNLNYHFIGFELNKEYCNGADIRLKNVPARLETFENHILEG